MEYNSDLSLWWTVLTIAFTFALIGASNTPVFTAVVWRTTSITFYCTSNSTLHDSATQTTSTLQCSARKRPF